MAKERVNEIEKLVDQVFECDVNTWPNGNRALLRRKLRALVRKVAKHRIYGDEGMTGWVHKHFGFWL